MLLLSLITFYIQPNATILRNKFDFKGWLQIGRAFYLVKSEEGFMLDTLESNLEAWLPN